MHSVDTRFCGFRFLGWSWKLNIHLNTFNSIVLVGSLAMHFLSLEIRFFIKSTTINRNKLLKRFLKLLKKLFITWNNKQYSWFISFCKMLSKCFSNIFIYLDGMRESCKNSYDWGSCLYCLPNNATVVMPLLWRTEIKWNEMW